MIHSVAYGFQIALQPMNLVYCFLGVLIGTLVGVLPGLGPSATIAILLPSTFHLPPVSGIIMLAGIWYGVMYGGSTTSILVNIPGEPASVVTCLDGYQMARAFWVQVILDLPKQTMVEIPHILGRPARLLPGRRLSVHLS